MTASQDTSPPNFNIPNALTGFRVVLIPVLVMVFYLPYGWSGWGSAAVFGVAAITDWLDGYLARALNQSTRFGAFMDPVADKLMVAVAVVVLLESYPSAWFAVPAAVIIGREIAISALREWMAELGQRASVAVSYMGKVKTGVQMASILLLLLCSRGAPPLFIGVGLVLFYLAAGLTLWSMVLYLRAAWPLLMA